MALVDPNIAMSFRMPEMPNQMANYAQMQQIQSGQLQNQLARQQMEQEQGATNYLRGADLSTPEGRAGLRQFGKVGMGYENLISEQEANALKRKELEGKVREQRMTALGTGLTSVLKDPSDANLAAAFDRLDATGVDTKPFRKSLLSEPDIAKRQAVITQYVTSNPEGRQALTFVQPKPEKMDLNGKIVMIDTNPNSPTYKQEIQQFAKTQTFADKNAAARLTFDQNKFAWEKANPGFELKEADDGSIVGVNKRTLQAVPVTIGGAAPAAVPAAAGAGMPGAQMPTAQAPLAGATPTAGRPLMGKGTALTESQSNATAYGMRMLEANQILEDLAKQGVVKGAVIEGTPFIGGALGQALPSALGGTSAAQQQVNQAKSNFITAQLRKESGASISDAEFAREEKKYFPQINDSDEVIKQKAKARKLAIEAMKIQAGPGAKNIGRAGAPSANDPLGLGI